jgi:hypothetical protein
MAGRITVSTLNNDTGVLATQNGMTGIPKAWVQFNGFTSSIYNSFNVSSVTRNSTGDYTINFTTVLSSANYSSVGNCGFGFGSDGSYNIVLIPYTTIPTTSAIRFTSVNYNTAVAADATYTSAAIFGA